MANSDEEMLAVLASLEQCRATLVATGNRESAHLISIAILDLRMKLNRLSKDDLKSLCDEMVQADNPDKLRDPKLQPGQRRQPLLRTIK